ncbi:hypothetical protein BD309DRAFT_873835 [Dichomitus squalens]|uniref:Uncharacterized protein n=2 Tax=Dichomitus squalens TaxID=114155 RepID=A0A4Q9PAG1_9APHY|nr:uncharacterized protein DICSQDRAFT_156561 [Dichomitus squalens LYAD-421 SS1]EJF58765.1 hypothetical protein DICSQDRAFT_156561 [Dichomitus squalens LYAD-421 SS1]TBU38688.1 hypothetical protein BD309DRAFT_873835 [Dichomitus squalens]TBU51680.1 hypothetical protein BD310DRAFT_953144 [Dichomitus squalens]
MSMSMAMAIDPDIGTFQDSRISKDIDTCTSNTSAEAGSLAIDPNEEPDLPADVSR